jgi:hypothetical protein
MDRPPGLWNCDCHLRVCGNPATNKELAMKLVKLSLLVVMTALLGSLPAFGRPFTPRDLVMLSHLGIRPFRPLGDGSHGIRARRTWPPTAAATRSGDSTCQAADGRSLAWVATARAGYEDDRKVLTLRNLASGETRRLTQHWDRSIHSIAWASDSASLYVWPQADSIIRASGSMSGMEIWRARRDSNSRPHGS